MTFPFGETVTVQTAGSVTDPYSGEAAEDWDNPSEVTVEGVAVEPRPSSEYPQDARNAVTSGFTLYMPPGVAVTTRNRITVRGETYDVLGEPAEWRSPFSGWAPGVVVQVGKTKG